jgi:sulfur relay (sulfurtransferase) complex TusBCD TusD component (DsrE family)
VAEVFSTLIDHSVPVYVWERCSFARGVTEADLQGKNAQFTNPQIAAGRMATADRAATF